MANVTEPEIFFFYPTKRIYSIKEIVNFAQIPLFWLGFLSALPMLVVFFRQGFKTSLNIGFFSLALADLAVCVVYGTASTAGSFQRYFRNTWIFKDAVRELYAWITAVICWERLCNIILPEKVGFNTLKLNLMNFFYYFSTKCSSVHQELPV